jgi:hypothetical protein
VQRLPVNRLPRADLAQLAQVHDRHPVADLFDQAKTTTMPSTTGTSWSLIDWTKMSPAPGSEKIGSMIAVAPISVSRLSPTRVIRPNIELGSACLSRIRQGRTSLARAVTM